MSGTGTTSRPVVEYEPANAWWSCVYSFAIGLPFLVAAAVKGLTVPTANWKDVGDTVQAFATAAGIVVGGIFAYYKFVNDRIYRPRANLDIQAGHLDVGEARFLKCSIEVENRGNKRLQVQQAGTAVEVCAGRGQDTPFHAMRWRKPSSGARPEDDGVAIVRVFARHHWIESKEAIRDEVLVRIPSGDDQVYRVLLRFVVKSPSPLSRQNIDISTSRIVRASDGYREKPAAAKNGDQE